MSVLLPGAAVVYADTGTLGFVTPDAAGRYLAESSTSGPLVRVTWVDTRDQCWHPLSEVLLAVLAVRILGGDPR